MVPLLILGWLAFSQNNCWGFWLLKVLAAGAYCWLIFQFASWYLLSDYGRYMMLGLYVAAVLYSGQRLWNLPAWRSLLLQAWVLPTGAAPTGALLLLGVVLFNLLTAYRGYQVPPSPVNLAFPLKEGTYYIGQGGSHASINGHMKVAQAGLERWRGQLWALDVVKLNAFGNRAGGIYPKDLASYAIFGESVYAPCNGVVVDTENTAPDLPPPNRVESDAKTGNHVLLQCRPDAYVLLAHLQQGSVLVSLGQAVQAGDKLGTIGNSGNSAEPHLHIHAQHSVGQSTVADADPRPMVFDNKFLVRGEHIQA
ncbi:M23 family metallopeptidase [Nodosilinea sp. LEGE 07298]|nr:M23 family metallopeptidase [Nodosilinea sp. LEGE 07298]